MHRYSEYGKLIWGVDRRFLESSKWLKRLGVNIFAMEYNPSYFRSLEACGYSPIEISQKFRKHHILNLFFFVYYGVKFCRKLSIDLIYSADGDLTENVIGSFIVSRICRKPLAIIFHHVHRFDKSTSGIIIEQSKHRANLIILFSMMILASFRRFVYRKVEIPVAVSRATAEDLESIFGLRNATVIGNGIDISRFQDGELQPKLFDGVYLGRVSVEKGVDTLLRSWRLVADEFPSSKLLIVGGFSEDWTRFNRNLLGDLDLESNATMVGFRPDEEAVTLLKSSKIFVLPSNEEGFGLSVLEAMACGLPCILSDIPALRENFTSKAIFVPPKDPEKLASAILDLLSDPDKHSHLKEIGLETVKDFSWNVVAEKELEAYKRKCLKKP